MKPKNIAGSVGKITGKTLRVLKDTPSKTGNKLTTAKSEFISGFRNEIPTKEIKKIGEVETLTPEVIN
jgi:hypothetical protein